MKILFFVNYINKNTMKENLSDVRLNKNKKVKYLILNTEKLTF